MYINFDEYIYSFVRKVFIIVQHDERTALEKFGLFFLVTLMTAVYLRHPNCKDYHQGH